VTPVVALRPATEADFDALFELESDVVGADMIAFLPREPGDRDAFTTHWTRIASDPDLITRVIEADGGFAGYAVSFVVEGERQVGYWIARELWGRGIASAALVALVAELDQRPLWGSTAADNVGSQRVLTNAGFVFDRTERSHAPRRGTEIDENVYRLD
jgi:RimJ/RimL family protein N-acetyltransferase